jgi:imidazolonepropionase-like amidohydrolase
MFHGGVDALSAADRNAQKVRLAAFKPAGEGMAVRHILADACFDGELLLDRGPFLVTVADGVIAGMDRAAPGTAADIAGGFLMPGLVEAHAHVFLDGSPVDRAAGNGRGQAPHAQMLDTARVNLAKCIRAGVTVVRDAGDRYGVNHAMRDELRARGDMPIALRSPGAALKRANRYGGFIGGDVGGHDDIVAAVAERCRASDDIKIILTGIVDFTAGCVKGEPQFDVDELRLIVHEAHARGRKTFAHCSGLAGLRVATAAGVDSIEHGYFMTRDILVQMADKGIAWVPTLAPVRFQRAEPHHAGWDEATVGNLARILDTHAEHVALAHELGVAVLAGSDAGSPGVDHGAGLIDELVHLLRAGLPMKAVLRAATSLPRTLWEMAPARIARGHRADMILLERSPFDDPAALRAVRLVCKGECCAQVNSGEREGDRASLPLAHETVLDTDDGSVARPCRPSRRPVS